MQTTHPRSKFSKAISTAEAVMIATSRKQVPHLANQLD